MKFSRREVLKLSGMAVVTTPFALSMGLPLVSRRAGRLFFDPDEIDRIRANASTPLLKGVFESWRSVTAADMEAVYANILSTQELLYDFGPVLEGMYRQATLALLTDDDRHKTMLLRGLETLHELEHWDYMRDGGTRPLGLMRASKATTATLFALEVLGDDVDESMRAAMMDDVAEKGCAPCHLTIHQMNNPEEAAGWGVDEIHKETIKWDMSRWPWILAINNLRAIPTMGLGLGALALRGSDDRAGAWLRVAEDSARRYLNLHEPDGSYAEGISYVDYAFRTLFLFLEAHYRVMGDIDWVTEINFEGVTEFITCLQAGKKASGDPDIINISDSRHSVFVCVPAWIAKRSGSRLAGHAARNYARPGYFADFLWYDDHAQTDSPSVELKNKRFELDWVVTRSGWGDDDTVLSFRSGPPTNHEHADRNTVMLKSRGERLLTEHFGASYDSRDEGWLLRLPIAHNAVLIDGHGHQYHNGEEGTNAGKAFARIVQYEAAPDWCYWTSDATPGYRLVDSDISLVRRSVIFVKPELVLILDETEKSTKTGITEILFHPDNRDDAAGITILGATRFRIDRPNASLHGACYSEGGLALTVKKLALSDEYGSFPYLSVATGEATRSTVLTVLGISGSNETASLPTVERTALGWEVATDKGVNVVVELTAGEPAISIT